MVGLFQKGFVAGCFGVLRLLAGLPTTAQAQWDAERFERFGGPGGGPRPPIAPFTTVPLSNRRVVVPMVFPVIGARSWRDGYNTNRSSHRHTGIDILAPKMRPVVAPFSGILGFKTQTFWIWGDNGYKCLGTHLNDDTPGKSDNRAEPDFMFAPNLRPGDRVQTGQLIGYVGDSGVASGPHLHFEMFAPGNELVNPFPSLKVASRINTVRAVLSNPANRPSIGQARIEGCIRGWDSVRRVLTLLLVARQTSGGRAFAYTIPTRYRLTVPPEIVQEAGGSEKIGAVPRDRIIIFHVEETPSANGHKSNKSSNAHAGLRIASGTAIRLVLPVDSEGEAANTAPSADNPNR